MGHTNRWCPVVDEAIAPEDRIRNTPCPYCGTRLPKDYDRVDITDQARQQGAQWKAAREQAKNASREEADSDRESLSTSPARTQPPAQDDKRLTDLLASPSGSSGPSHSGGTTTPGGSAPPVPATRRRIPRRLIGFGVFGLYLLIRSVFFSGDPSLYDLDIGDCFDDPTDYSVEATEVESVEGRNCSEPHQSQFVGTYDSLLLRVSSSFPSDQDLSVEATEECGLLVEAFTGVPLGQSLLDMSYYTQTPRDWRAQRDPAVRCAVYSYVSVSESVQDRGRDYELGCYTWEDVLVPCSARHGFEQYAFAWHPVLVGSFPGESSIDAWAGQLCDNHFESYVGSPENETEYVVWWIAPDETTWSEDDRLLSCFLSSVSDEFIKGSAWSSS